MPKEKKISPNTRAKKRADNYPNMPVWPERDGRVFVKRGDEWQAVETMLERERLDISKREGDDAGKTSTVINTVSDGSTHAEPERSDVETIQKTDIDKIIEQLTGSTELVTVNENKPDSKLISKGKSRKGSTEPVAGCSKIDKDLTEKDKASSTTLEDDIFADKSTGSSTPINLLRTGNTPDQNDPDYDELSAIANAVSSSE